MPVSWGRAKRSANGYFRCSRRLQNRVVKIAVSQFTFSDPADAIKHGIGFVTEDRKRFGLVLDQTILSNMTLAGLRRISGRFITRSTLNRRGERAMKDLRESKLSFHHRRDASGGQPAEVVLAKWLLTNPRVLFLDEPTAASTSAPSRNLCADQRLWRRRDSLSCSSRQNYQKCSALIASLFCMKEE